MKLNCKIGERWTYSDITNLKFIQEIISNTKVVITQMLNDGGDCSFKIGKSMCFPYNIEGERWEYKILKGQEKE